MLLHFEDAMGYARLHRCLHPEVRHQETRGGHQGGSSELKDTTTPTMSWTYKSSKFLLLLASNRTSFPMAANAFNPGLVNLTTADPTQVICALNASGNDYDGRLGARISALFVILIVSTAVTFFPVAAKRVRWLKVSLRSTHQNRIKR